MNLSPTKWFSLIIAIITVTNIAILLDIPILRQISGYIFLRHKDIAVDGIVTQYPHIFVGKNKIYSSGASPIYK